MADWRKVRCSEERQELRQRGAKSVPRARVSWLEGGALNGDGRAELRKTRAGQIPEALKAQRRC